MTLDRRQFVAASLATSALSACAPSLGGARGSKVAPSTFVLIHGAWHGGWCWREVQNRLEAQGHMVLAPTLAGLGERVREASATIGLETHIADVVSVIEAGDLRNVILVGHSYGGMVVTGVVDRLKSRIGHIVYLDAAVPENGDSMVTYGPKKTEAALAAGIAGLRSLVRDGVSMEPLPPEAFGIPVQHPLYAWVKTSLTPHPLKTWLDSIALANGGSTGVRRTYVHCIAPVLAQTAFPYIAAKVRTDPTWSYAELQTGHDAMITDPDNLVTLLLGVATTRNR